MKKFDIRFKIGNGHGCIGKEILTEQPKTKVLKLFKLILEYGYENQEAVQQIGAALMELKTDKFDAWKMKSQEFNREYRLPDNYESGVRQKVKARNKRLEAAVKKAKKDYESICELQKRFEGLRSEYSN